VTDQSIEEKKEGFVVVLFILQSLPLVRLVSRAASVSEHSVPNGPGRW